MLGHAQDPEASDQLTQKQDDALYCRICGTLLTRARWALPRIPGFRPMDGPYVSAEVAGLMWAVALTGWSAAGLLWPDLRHAEMSAEIGELS